MPNACPLSEMTSTLTGEQAYSARKHIANDTSNATEMEWTRTRAVRSNNDPGTTRRGAPTPPRAATHPGTPKKELRIDELLKQAVKGVDLIRNALYEISASTWTIFQISLGSYRAFAEEACRQIAMAAEVETAKKPGLSTESAWDKPRRWGNHTIGGGTGPTGASSESAKATESGY